MLGALIFLGVVLAVAVAIGVTWAVHDRRDWTRFYSCDEKWAKWREQQP